MRWIGLGESFLSAAIQYDRRHLTGIAAPSMFSDIRRIMVWLAAGAALLILLPALSEFSDRPYFWIIGIVAVLAVAVTFHFLIESFLAAGSRALPSRQDGCTRHRLGWGAVVLVGIISAGIALAILYVLQGSEPFWLWSLSILGIAGCIYFVVATVLYRVVCDERVLWVRGSLLRWNCHEWDDLASIYHNDSGEHSWLRYSYSQLRLRFTRTEFVELPACITGYDNLLAVANAALERNNLDKGDDDA